MRRSTALAIGCSALALTLAGCDSDIDVRIGEALKGTAESVTLSDTHVIARCTSGDEAKVPLAQLELDIFGMADIEKQTAVAQSLQQQCEAAKKKKAQAERTESALEKAAASLAITVEGKDQAALRQEVCAALAKQLPRKGDERARKIAEHTRDFGCEDPGEPELGPERLWLVEEKGAGAKKALYLRLDSEVPEGEAPDQLTIKCGGKKKLDAYIATTTRLKKGPLSVAVDGKKARWRTTLSKSKKAVFLKDAKKAVKALLDKDQLVVTLPAKGAPKRVFPIDGIEAALAAHKKTCGI